MNRAFDPALLGVVDQGWFPDEADAPDEDFTLAERCTICGADDLVRDEEQRLVNLDGEPHKCPEEAA